MSLMTTKGRKPKSPHRANVCVTLPRALLDSIESYALSEFHTRAEALERARAVLVSRTPLSAAKIEFPHEVTGLARYIVDGEDVFNYEATFTGENAPVEP